MRAFLDDAVYDGRIRVEREQDRGGAVTTLPPVR
jgi:hypothetical protein